MQQQATARSRPVEDRFWEKVVEAPSGCWLWTAGRYASGYGYIRLGGVGSRRVAAHRFAYEWVVGKIPDGLVIDHLCRNRACVNPAHLEPVTQRENLLRGYLHDVGAGNRAKTHCPRGHEYTAENTRHGGGRTGRVCRACERDRHRRARGTL